jgi:glycine/D-amino acid oxidase-like deaminating enzyme
MTCGSCRYDGWRQRGRGQGARTADGSVTVARRLTIIGGGVMGLMTAYHAAPLAKAVTVLELWRGTGYTFAPWMGKVLAQLAVQRGTVYDIGRFTPSRFGGGATNEPLAGGMAS